MQNRLTKGLLVLFAWLVIGFSSSAIILPPTKTATLKWDYPYEASEIVFNVYGSTNLSMPMRQWTLLTNVTALSCSVPIKANANFFTVIASNQVTRLHSGFGN
jgi:hypothetical protein